MQPPLGLTATSSAQHFPWRTGSRGLTRVLAKTGTVEGQERRTCQYGPGTEAIVHLIWTFCPHLLLNEELWDAWHYSTCRGQNSAGDRRPLGTRLFPQKKDKHNTGTVLLLEVL